MSAPINSKGAEVKPNPSGPASVYIFKSSIEEHIGEINYFRVYSGKITENLDVINSNNGTKERLSNYIYVPEKIVREFLSLTLVILVHLLN